MAGASCFCCVTPLQKVHRNQAAENTVPLRTRTTGDLPATSGISVKPFTISSKALGHGCGPSSRYLCPVTGVSISRAHFIGSEKYSFVNAGPAPKLHATSSKYCAHWTTCLFSVIVFTLSYQSLYRFENEITSSSEPMSTLPAHTCANRRDCISASGPTAPAPDGLMKPTKAQLGTVGSNTVRYRSWSSLYCWSGNDSRNTYAFLSKPVHRMISSTSTSVPSSKITPFSVQVLIL
mmetsp:Transcript_59189/g.109381  ORF Transcript_59189/g.109381 Transcript_59189/m.109381 type:complete len:235 (+) Transcript_59189:49-753(+)